VSAVIIADVAAICPFLLIGSAGLLISASVL